MTKSEFISALDKKMAAFPAEDRQRTLEYYVEMIDDRMDEGLSEEEAVRSLGSIDRIYGETVSGLPLRSVILKRLTPTRRFKVWEYILIFFGFLVFGLPIIASLFAVAVSLLASLWAVVISLYAVPIALLGGGAVGVVVFFPTLFAGTTVKSLFILGSGLFSLGLIYPFSRLAIIFSRFAVFATKGMLIGLKKLIAG